MVQLSERGQHCPFLNRTDARCGDHFRLERLDHAFEYCFDRYTACPVYLELLVERRLRRASADLTGGRTDHHLMEANDVQRSVTLPGDRLVQVSIHVSRVEETGRHG